MVSSTDGYCSIVTFSQDELGKPYQKSDCDDAEVVDLPPSFQTLLQGEIHEQSVKPADDFHLAYDDTHMTLDAEPTQLQQQKQSDKVQESLLLSPTTMRSPRRVQLITLSSPKQRKK